MACFLVSAAEAVIVKVAETGAKKSEEAAIAEGKPVDTNKIPMSRKLSWLTSMLAGGAVLLMFEHVWHGEVTPFFPFLTAMSDPADMQEMFFEMATTGVGMALSVTAVWGCICAAADHLVKKPVDEAETNKEEA